jgi:8-oxo-dGTP pyrophosphatase MutT (NUDIX family)
MERLGGQVVYENGWMLVREDRIRFADGSLGSYGVVEKPDFALVIPAEADGFWMVNPYRYPIGRRAWEFPQGSWDPGVVPTSMDELAHAELAEETGLRCGRLERLGHLKSAYGFLDAGFDVFLATELVEGAPARGPGEHGMTNRFVPEADFAALVRDGDIIDAATVAAHALLAAAREAG